jgi:hypothetical protein
MFAESSQVVSEMFLEAASCIGTRGISASKKVVTATRCVPSFPLGYVKNITTEPHEELKFFRISEINNSKKRFLNAKHMI